MPMSTASAQDVELIHTLREVGALIPFRPERFHHSQATACCSDGFRVHMDEKIIEIWRRHQDVSQKPIMFRYRAHGLAMRLAKGNPLSPKDAAWEDFLEQFEEAQGFTHGEIQQFNLVHHWPCGAATRRHISLMESLLYVVMSKVRVKRFGPFREVSMVLWVDLAEGEHSVYRLKKEPFLEYLQALEDQTLWERWQQYEALLNIEMPSAELNAA